MQIEPVPWMSNREICPVDFDLNEYLSNIKVPRHIFLMGPGYDHIVGRANPDHSIVAITHSPGELCSYMSWAIENPTHSHNYQCLFGDIHLLDRSILGAFHVAALLHLGERYTEGGRSMEGILDMFRDVPILVFYTGSFAWQGVHPVVSASGRDLVEQYNSLAIYQ